MKEKKQTKTTFVSLLPAGGAIFFACLFFFVPLISRAATFDYKLLESFPGVAGMVKDQTFTDLPGLVSGLYNFGIWTVGIAALLMLVIGGFMYMTSAGNTSRVATAKGVIGDALLGLVAALGAYLLLYVINPDLTKINLNLMQVDVASQTSTTTTGGSAVSSGTTSSTAKCSNINAPLQKELNQADHGVPTALLASFLQRECTQAMSNQSACNKNNSYGAGGAMQFTDPTWKAYGCSGSKFNRQDALNCAAKKISKDSKGDYSEAAIRKTAKKYCGSCTDPKACGGDYCDGIVANYNTYKACPK